MALLSRVRNVLGLPDGERKGRWWPLLVLGLLAAVVVCVAVVWVSRGRYVASSYLRIAMQERDIALATENVIVCGEPFDIYKSTQRQLVMSRFLLLAALRKPEVTKLPAVLEAQANGDVVNWLARRLSVTFPGKAEIMEVSVRGNDPREAAVLCRAVVDAYLTEVVSAEREQMHTRLSKLDRAYVEKEQEIRTKREALKKRAETLGTSERADIEKLEAVLAGLATERESLRIGILSTPRITLIQRADEPEEPAWW
jgi:polysaccharide biosynthesis transport protein